jgi:hypothetical protein
MGNSGEKECGKILPKIIASSQVALFILFFRVV